MTNKVKLTFRLITHIAIFVIGFILALQVSNCSGKKPIIKTDTVQVVTIKTKIDTVFFTVEKPIYIKGKNPGFDSTKYKECNTLVNDSITMKDSLIDGKLALQIKNNQLLTYSFAYKPLFPKYINRTDSVFVTKTITNTIVDPKKNIIYLGVELGTRESGLTAGLKTKKDYMFYYRFGINIQEQKSHNVGVKFPLVKFKS
jgi:hypothetical protein